MLVTGISIGAAVVINKISVPATTKIENGLSAYELAVQYGYEGTVEEWKAISKGSSWNYNVPATKVVCKDGEVSLK